MITRLFCNDFEEMNICLKEAERLGAKLTKEERFFSCEVQK